jgi:hypothetical protein
MPYKDNEKRQASNRKGHLKSKYHISTVTYNAMDILQGFRCAICNNDKGNYQHLFIDHCHKSGEIRGLLCRNCNLVIGNAKDSITILRKAASYLESNICWSK